MPAPRAHLKHGKSGPRSAPVPSTLGKVISGRRDARISRKRLRLPIIKAKKY